MRSFGSPVEDDELQDELLPLETPAPPMLGRVALEVDLVLSEESLTAVRGQLQRLVEEALAGAGAAVEEHLAGVISRAVLAGFAAAAGQAAN